MSGTVVVLPSLVRNLFALRLTESLRRMWLDFHTLLGVCSLPFHIVMAATAAGFAFQRPIMTLEQSLFRPAPYVESTQGGHDGTHAHHHGGGHPGMERPLLDPGALVASLAEQVPDFEPDALVYSTRNGKLSLRVTGHDTRHVTRRPDGGYVDVDPYGGRITSMDFLPGHQGGGFLALTTIYALHFGAFGGLWGRAGYALLGFGGAFLFYSGNRLWLSSRRRRERSAGLGRTVWAHVCFRCLRQEGCSDASVGFQSFLRLFPCCRKGDIIRASRPYFTLFCSDVWLWRHGWGASAARARLSGWLVS
nr:PepSY-associated TM helix domain-containing protein [Gluconobacter oxydans]